MSPQRKGHFQGTWWDNGHARAEERCLRENQPYQYPDLGLPASRTQKISFHCLSHQVSGILQPYQINIPALALQM